MPRLGRPARSRTAKCWLVVTKSVRINQICRMTAEINQGNNDQQVEQQQNGAAGEMKSLGSGEQRLLDAETEEKGVEDILKALTPEQVNSMPDQNMPLRHFRAEKGKTQKAIEKLKATLEWRKEFDVDNILRAFETHTENESNKEQRAKFRDILLKENETGKVYVRGYNKDGRALMYLNGSRENTHELEGNMIHLVYCLERAIACTRKKSGGRLEKICMVFNYEKFSLRTAPPMKHNKQTMTILQDHYPERMYKCYSMNPPFVFKAFLALVKPFADPVSLEKIVLMWKDDKTFRAFQSTLDQKLDQELHGKEYKDVQIRPYDSKEFLNNPIDMAFDEQKN